MNTSFPFQISRWTITVGEKYAQKEKGNIDEEAELIIEHKLDALQIDISTQITINEGLLLIKNLIEQERINCSTPYPVICILPAIRKESG